MIVYRERKDVGESLYIGLCSTTFMGITMELTQEQIRKIETLTKMVEDLATAVREIKKAYDVVVEVTKSYKDDLQTVMQTVSDAIKKMVEQPRVHHEVETPELIDFPIIKSLETKGVVKTNLEHFKMKVKVDRNKLVRGILTGELSNLERITALKVLYKQAYFERG
jgi:PP-loop superfamily ATP-utilizing enzyme